MSEIEQEIWSVLHRHLGQRCQHLLVAADTLKRL